MLLTSRSAESFSHAGKDCSQKGHVAVSTASTLESAPRKVLRLSSTLASDTTLIPVRSRCSSRRRCDPGPIRRGSLSLRAPCRFRFLVPRPKKSCKRQPDSDDGSRTSVTSSRPRSARRVGSAQAGSATQLRSTLRARRSAALRRSAGSRRPGPRRRASRGGRSPRHRRPGPCRPAPGRGRLP